MIWIPKRSAQLYRLTTRVTVIGFLSLFVLSCESNAPQVETANTSDVDLAAKQVVALPEVKDAEQVIGEPISLLLTKIPDPSQRLVAKIERKFSTINQDPSRAASRPVSKLDESTASLDNTSVRIGVFDAKSGRLPVEIWQRSTGVQAIRSLYEIPDTLKSPTLHSLAHRILGVSAAPPQGSASWERFYRARIFKLYELGHANSVVAIARSIPREQQPAWLQELALRSLVAIGQDGEVCRNAGLIKKTPSTSAWLIRLRLACVLLSEGAEVAKQRIDRMLTTGQIANDQFAHLMRIALLEDPDRRVVTSLKPHADFEPELLLFDFVQITDKSNWFTRVEPVHLQRVMRSEALKADFRVDVAEYAALRGVISGRGLATVYQDAIEIGRSTPLESAPDSTEDRLSAIAQSGRRSTSTPISRFNYPAMQRADHFVRANKSVDNASRIANISEYLRASSKVGLLHVASEAAMPVIRNIPVVSENLGGADILIVASLLADEVELAELWLRLVLRDPVATHLVANSTIPVTYLKLVAAARGVIPNDPQQSESEVPEVPEAPSDNDSQPNQEEVASSISPNDSNKYTFTIPSRRGLGLPSVAMVTDVLEALYRDYEAEKREAEARAEEIAAEEGGLTASDANQGAAGTGETRESSQEVAVSAVRERLPNSREYKLDRAVAEERTGEAIAILTSFASTVYSSTEVAVQVIMALRELGLNDDAHALALEILMARRRVL